MLQPDPESMKQEAFGVETRNPVTGPSKRFKQGQITPQFNLTACSGLA